MSSQSSSSLSDSVYIAATIAAILFWSTSFVGTKLAYESFPPLTLGALRFVAASLLLGVIVLSRGGLAYIEKADRKIIALSGFLGITLYFTMENIGLSLTTASNAALIVASYPAITAMLDWAIYRTAISCKQITGIVMAMAGVCILTGMQGGHTGPQALWGNLILFATGFVWAFYNFTARKVVVKYPAMTFAFYQTLAGAVFFLPLTLFEIADWRAPTPTAVVMVCYLVVFCSVAGYMLYNFGMRRLAPSTMVSIMNLVPVFGVVFSVLILHESVSMSQVTGGVIVIGGVFLSLARPATASVPETVSE